MDISSIYGRPKQTGGFSMSQKKLDMLEKELKTRCANAAGAVVIKDGKTRYESYFNGFSADSALHVFSVTKSVFSILFGIAVDRGLIKSTGQRVLDFFEEFKPEPDERTLQSITIENLLTMTAPYKYDVEPYARFFESEQPVEDALRLLGGSKPVGRFNYSAIGGTHILSGIFTKAVGMSALEFAKENLFGPMEIDVPGEIHIHSEREHNAIMNDKNTRGWVTDPQGNSMASWGLFLRTADMAKLGQLYLNSGKWNGRQIVSSEWIERSTREYSRCDEWGLGYGYLWWIIDENSFAGMGDGGNVIYVNREKRLVTAVASLFDPQPADRIEIIKRCVEPLFD